MAQLNLRTPNGYDGQPATQYKMGVVRLATDEEALAGTSDRVAVTPAQVQAATSVDFASPPVLGFGSTTPRPVHATTLDSSGLTSLATGAGAVTNIGNATGTIGFFGVAAAARPGATTDIKTGLALMGLLTDGGATPLDLDGGALSAGTVSATTTVAAGTTVTAGTGITSTTGNIVAAAGNISATLGSITAATTVTATSGAITATNGNFVASTLGTGILLNSAQDSGAAASPVVVNGRSGRATFTSVSIAAAADLTLTITNSAITASTTEVLVSMSGATTGAALCIKSITASSGSLAIVVTNGTGATTSTADIQIDFLVLNA